MPSDEATKRITGDYSFSQRCGFILVVFVDDDDDDTTQFHSNIVASELQDAAFESCDHVIYRIWPIDRTTEPSK